MPGFSNGCAELALNQPPPLVPSSLIASWNATGPSAMVCAPAFSVCAVAKGVLGKVCGEPARTRTIARMIEAGSSR